MVQKTYMNGKLYKAFTPEELKKYENELVFEKDTKAKISNQKLIENYFKTYNFEHVYPNVKDPNIKPFLEKDGIPLVYKHKYTGKLYFKSPKTMDQIAAREILDNEEKLDTLNNIEDTKVYKKLKKIGLSHNFIIKYFEDYNSGSGFNSKNGIPESFPPEEDEYNQDTMSKNLNKRVDGEMEIDIDDIDDIDDLNDDDIEYLRNKIKSDKNNVKRKNDLETEIKSNNKLNTRNDLETDGENDSEKDTENHLETDAENDLETDGENDLETDIESDLETDSESDLETDSESESEYYQESSSGLSKNIKNIKNNNILKKYKFPLFVIQIILFSIAFYLSYKCNKGLKVLDILIAFLCSPCYIVYRLAVPCK